MQNITDSTTICKHCGGPRTKGGAHGLCKRCYQGEASGKTCELCGKPISRRAKRCGSCSLKGTHKTPEHITNMVRSRMRGRWARDWDHCQECGTTEVRHFARGLCCKCYYRVWQSNHPYEPKKVKPIPAYRTKEWLHQRYEVENLSVVQCAELAGVETYVISHWLHRNNITVCRGKAHRGKIIRPETRRKMSLRMKGQNNHQFGKKGPACPNWKGGVSHEPYPFGFNDALKKTIRERDGKCVICGSTSGRLAVHHIDYNKANIAQSNLVALCPNCHSKTNGNRSVWQDRLSEYIKELAQC